MNNALTVHFRVRIGWLNFVIAVANRLARARLHVVAGIWLWLLQPTCIIGIHIEGQRHHLGPFRFGRRWSYRRANIRVHLHLRRQRPRELSPHE